MSTCNVCGSLQIKCEYLEKCKTLTEEIARLQAKLKEANAATPALETNKITEITPGVSQTQQISELQTQIAALEHERDNLLSNLTKIDAINSTLQDNNEALTAQNAELQATVENPPKALLTPPSSQEDKNEEEVQSEINDLKDQLKTATASIDHLSAINTDLQAVADKEKADINSKNEKLQEKINGLNVLIEDSNTEITSLKDQNAVLKKQIDDANTPDDTAKELSTTRQQLLEAQKKITANKKEIAAFIRTGETRDTRFTTYKQEQKQEVAKLTAHNGSLETKLRQSEAKLEESEKDKQDYMTRATANLSAKTENKTLQATVKQLRARIARLSSDLDAIKDEKVKGLNQQNDALALFEASDTKKVFASTADTPTKRSLSEYVHYVYNKITGENGEKKWDFNKDQGISLAKQRISDYGENLKKMNEEYNIKTNDNWNAFERKTIGTNNYDFRSYVYEFVQYLDQFNKAQQTTFLAKATKIGGGYKPYFYPSASAMSEFALDKTRF